MYLSHGGLDRRIAAGRPIDASAALRLRAEQLTDHRARLRLARDLRGAVEYVDRLGSRRMISAVVIEPAAVIAGRQALLGLAERLERPSPVSPRGVGLVVVLLTDGLSPLFNPRAGRTVVEAVWEVADALEIETAAPAQSLTQHLF